MAHERFMELERQLLVSLSARDQRIAQLTDELALKSSLLEQAEANVTETAKRAGLELHEHDDRPPMPTLKVQTNNVAETQAKLEELPLSRGQQIAQYEKKLEDVQAKLEAESEALRLRLTGEEKGWSKNNAEVQEQRRGRHIQHPDCSRSRQRAE